VSAVTLLGTVGMFGLGILLIGQLPPRNGRHRGDQLGVRSRLLMHL
jgi:hypothetical protein